MDEIYEFLKVCTMHEKLGNGHPAFREFQTRVLRDDFVNGEGVEWDNRRRAARYPGSMRGH